MEDEFSLTSISKKNEKPFELNKREGVSEEGITGDFTSVSEHLTQLFGTNQSMLKIYSDMASCHQPAPSIAELFNFLNQSYQEKHIKGSELMMLLELKNNRGRTRFDILNRRQEPEIKQALLPLLQTLYQDKTIIDKKNIKALFMAMGDTLRPEAFSKLILDDDESDLKKRLFSTARIMKPQWIILKKTETIADQLFYLLQERTVNMSQCNRVLLLKDEAGNSFINSIGFQKKEFGARVLALLKDLSVKSNSFNISYPMVSLLEVLCTHECISLEELEKLHSAKQAELNRVKQAGPEGSKEIIIFDGPRLISIDIGEVEGSIERLNKLISDIKEGVIRFMTPYPIYAQWQQRLEILEKRYQDKHISGKEIMVRLKFRDNYEMPYRIAMGTSFDFVLREPCPEEMNVMRQLVKFLRELYHLDKAISIQDVAELFKTNVDHTYIHRLIGHGDPEIVQSLLIFLGECYQLKAISAHEVVEIITEYFCLEAFQIFEVQIYHDLGNMQKLLALFIKLQEDKNLPQQDLVDFLLPRSKDLSLWRWFVDNRLAKSGSSSDTQNVLEQLLTLFNALDLHKKISTDELKKLFTFKTEQGNTFISVVKEQLDSEKFQAFSKKFVDISPVTTTKQKGGKEEEEKEGGVKVFDATALPFFNLSDKEPSATTPDDDRDTPLKNQAQMNGTRDKKTP